MGILRHASGGAEPCSDGTLSGAAATPDPHEYAFPACRRMLRIALPKGSDYTVLTDHITVPANAGSSDMPRHADYSRVSEIPGIRVTPEAVSMLLSRYTFASGFCKDKDVLELGCGAGIGLGYLARYARTLVGGDYTESMLSTAMKENSQQALLVRLDAQRLPFKDSCFDVVLLFEAIYYLPSPPAVLQECRRVLRRPGTLVICSVNREWSGFSPSALSCGYFSALELRQLLHDNGFEAEIYGGFQTAAETQTEKMKDRLRRVAVRFNLIPKTMRGKEFLKRIFYGGLVKLTTRIDEGMTVYDPPVVIPLEAQKAANYKVIYSVAHVGMAPRAGRAGGVSSCASSSLINR
jgi:ubiquinone/menaquinone biosynthesis C-methylase UbiE